MATLRRALLQGLGFGLAAAMVTTWLSLVPVVQLRFGPGASFVLQVAALQLGLGGLLGLAAAPLLRLPWGRALHVLVIALAWYGLERWVALEVQIFAMLDLAAPVGGALLVLLSFRIGRRRPLLPWAIGLVLLVAGVAAAPLYLKATTPPQAARGPLPPALAGAPDVVLVVLDTVRASSVSTYGYERPTAPALDALAAEGALFLDATSPSTWSMPSHASLFTGRYPSSHGAHWEHVYLDDRFPTLADVLSFNGYETFCFTANAWISDGLGLTRGFAWQDESLRNQGGAGLGFLFVYRLLDRLGLQETDKGGATVIDSFGNWAAARPADAARPAFVFVNLIEAHFPYHQLPHDMLFRFTDRGYGELRAVSLDLLGAQFGGERQLVDVQEPTRAMYDGGVVHSSNLLARIVEALRARGTLDRTILVVMADHGELLGERADFYGHGPSLYQEVVGVPLLVRYPPRVPAGTRVARPVSTVGVFATILDLAGIEAPPTLQVGSLVPLIEGDPTASGGPILSEIHRNEQRGERVLPDPQMHRERRYRLLREGSLKLVTTSEGEALLYDLESDPGETRDVASERPFELAQMRASLEAVKSQLGLPDIAATPQVGADAPALDDATRERLQALGYAQ